MINFGKYDQKVTFINFQSVSDGAGGTTLTPINSLITFASVNQTRGNNGVESGQNVLPNTYQVRIQYRTTFTPNINFQIFYASKYYKITGVQLNDERQHKEYIINMLGV